MKSKLLKEFGSTPEIVAIYCPLWHNYDHASSWKGEGWCEWELLKNAEPRFEGHYQPYVPTWGHFDESDPAWSEKEIDLAADHGIDVFLVDWYWYSGVKIMEEALEKGLLKAKNKDRLKFALMWANHEWADYFPAPFGQKWNSWLPCRHTPNDWLLVMDYCMEHYFNQPHYWHVEGHLFFSLFQPTQLIRQMGGRRAFSKVLDKTQTTLFKKGLPPLHLNAMVRGDKDIEELKEAGFASTTVYNITKCSGTRGNPVVDYRDVAGEHPLFWKKMSTTQLPFMPVVTMGWDVTPRCQKEVSWPFPPSPLTGKQNYPYTHVVVGNTPERFGRLCKDAVEFCRKSNSSPNAFLINAWNEWTEGCFLLPEKRYGMGYLDALRDAIEEAEQ